MELVNILVDIYTNRRMLQLSLSDSKSIENSLDEVVFFVFFLIAFVCELSVFGVDVTAAVIALSSFFLAASFAIGPVIQALLYSFVLIFFVKPYNVGDRISIGTGTDIYIVQSISLWVTDMLDTTGKRHYFHNGSLATEHIVNHTRTSSMTISVDLGLSMSTPSSVITLIQDRINELVLDDNVLFDQSPSVTMDSLQIEKNMMTVNVYMTVKCGWYDPRRWDAKARVMHLLKHIIQEQNLHYISPSQPVYKLIAEAKKTQ